MFNKLFRSALSHLVSVCIMRGYLWRENLLQAQYWASKSNRSWHPNMIQQHDTIVQMMLLILVWYNTYLFVPCIPYNSLGSGRNPHFDFFTPVRILITWIFLLITRTSVHTYFIVLIDGEINASENVVISIRLSVMTGTIVVLINLDHIVSIHDV